MWFYGIGCLGAWGLQATGVWDFGRGVMASKDQTKTKLRGAKPLKVCAALKSTVPAGIP